MAPGIDGAFIFLVAASQVTLDHMDLKDGESQQDSTFSHRVNAWCVPSLSLATCNFLSLVGNRFCLETETCSQK